MKKNFNYILAGLSIVLVSSCTYQTNNSIVQKDCNKDSEWVYGVSPDSSAAQLKITYAANPALEAKATKIKEILYGSSEVAAVATTDSTAK